MSSKTSKTSNTDRVGETFERLTQAVIEAIESNPGDWSRPWKNGLLDHGMPTNTTGHVYAGGNALITLFVGIEKGYSSSVWGTFKQWQTFLGNEKGLGVRKGEKATYLLRPKVIKLTGDRDGNTYDPPKVITRFSAFAAFNADQVQGAAEKLAEINAAVFGDAPSPIEAAERFVAGTGADISFGGSSAYYMPPTDQIKVPVIDAFDSAEAFYATAIHELGHWTGAKHRLNREGITGRRTVGSYGFEELIAELTAVFVGCGVLGLNVEPRADHAQYLAHWLGQIKEDPKALWRAAGHAAKAAQFLQDRQPSEKAAPVPTMARAA